MNLLHFHSFTFKTNTMPSQKLEDAVKANDESAIRKALQNSDNPDIASIVITINKLPKECPILMHYCILGKYEFVKLLLDKSADPNVSSTSFRQSNTMTPHNGGTPLICAAYIGHVEIIRLLLQKSADPSFFFK